jgi:hypothetical protein
LIAGVDARGNTYGNYLTEADADAGHNFLTQTSIAAPWIESPLVAA